MRVLHVVRQFHPSVGGLEGMVRALACQQRSSGLDAEVLTLDRILRDPSAPHLASHEHVDGVPVRRIGCFGPARYPVAPKVLGHLSAFDLVHVHGVDFFCDYLAATAPLHRKPMVLSTHGGFFHTSFARRLKRVYFGTVTRGSLARYRRVLACSQQDRELFHPVAGDRIRLIENGVDIAKFANAASATYAPSLVYFGRLAPHKGLARLLDAFSVMSRRLPDARLLIAGNDWDGMLGGLMEKSAEARAQGRVRIVTGLSDGDLHREVEACSFFITASEYEGFGLALVEALSAGLIPIANRIPNSEAILSGAGVGLLTDFSDPLAAGHAMADYVRNCRSEHPKLRANAIAASRRYAWERVEQDFRAEYEAVLGTRRRPILGVDLVPLGREEAVDRLDDSVMGKQPLRVAFANAHTLTVASRDASFRAALRRFLVLNDGVGVDIASRIKFGRRFPANLNGTDFVPYFLGHTRHRLKIYLVGAKPTVIAEAARRFSARWPQHRIVGARDGYFPDEQAIEALCRDIRASRADVVLVGLGNPLQELWIDRHGDATGAPLLIGVGALFDFTAGRVSRAPLWIRRARGEWLYRLAQEPRRLAGRYLVGNAAFLRWVMRDRNRGSAP